MTRPSVTRGDAQESNRGGKADTPRSAGQNAAIDARVILDDAEGEAQRILEAAQQEIALVAQRAAERIAESRCALRDRASALYRGAA